MNYEIPTYRDANISIRHLILPQLPLQMRRDPYSSKRPLLGQNKLRIEHFQVFLSCHEDPRTPSNTKHSPNPKQQIPHWNEPQDPKFPKPSSPNHHQALEPSSNYSISSSSNEILRGAASSREHTATPSCGAPIPNQLQEQALKKVGFWAGEEGGREIRTHSTPERVGIEHKRSWGMGRQEKQNHPKRGLEFGVASACPSKTSGRSEAWSAGSNGTKVVSTLRRCNIDRWIWSWRIYRDTTTNAARLLRTGVSSGGCFGHLGTGFCSTGY